MRSSRRSFEEGALMDWRSRIAQRVEMLIDFMPGLGVSAARTILAGATASVPGMARNAGRGSIPVAREAHPRRLLLEFNPTVAHDDTAGLPPMPAQL